MSRNSSSRISSKRGLPHSQTMSSNNVDYARHEMPNNRRSIVDLVRPLLAAAVMRLLLLSHESEAEALAVPGGSDIEASEEIVHGR